jgi:hypothetical protein
MLMDVCERARFGRADAIDSQIIQEHNMEVAEYSPYSLVVTGDTKKFKDKLKDIGGKYNGKLSVGPGWIFPKKDLEKLQQTFGKDIQVKGVVNPAAGMKSKICLLLNFRK